MPSTPSTLEPSHAFGDFLRQLRRRAGFTQGELAALVGFSVAQISRLEKNERLPDLAVVAREFVPALALGDEPRLAQHLLELAALARGERLPAQMQIERRIIAVVQEQEVAHDSTLPALPTPLVGRERDLDMIAKRLMEAPGRLLTLIGPPGVGKTQLALAAAARLSYLLERGARFIALAAITDPHNVAAAIVAGLGLTEADGKSPQARLIEHLRRQKILLVLDNFEQVTAAAPLVAQLLSECAHLRILVTSQEPLRLRSEQRQRVEPLGVAAAVELFFQRALAIDPNFEISNEQAAIAADICLRLDCLPLAIELLAAQTESFTLPQLVSRLTNQRLDLLEDGPRDLPTHQRTLRNAIHRSYALLEKVEQQLFCSLGVFAGGCTMEALTAVMHTLQDGQNVDWPEEEVIAALRQLVRKSLVQMDASGPPRYHLLTMLHEYAAEQLALRPEQAHLRQAHAHHFYQWAQALQTQPASDQSKQWLDDLALDHDNLRAALHWSLHNDHALALKLAGALAEFWALRGHDYEARQWLGQVLAAHPAQTLARAAALLAAAGFARRQADFAEAEKYMRESLAIYAAKGERSGLAEALRQDGWLQYDLHRKKPTIARFSQSLALQREMGHQQGVAELLLCLVHVMVREPELVAEVRGYLSESLQIFQELGDREGIVKVLQQQGEQKLMAGEYAAAQVDFEAALALWRELGARLNVAWSLAQVGEAAWLQKDLATASQCYAEAHKLFSELGNKDGVAILQHHMAQVARKEGDLARAERFYAESLAMAHALQNRHMVARCLAGLGAVAGAAGNSANAQDYLSQAQRIFSELAPFLPPADWAEWLMLQSTYLRGA
ncbi:MAG: tetratricopeptide repeat protein [Caldilineaceae bacterium]